LVAIEEHRQFHGDGETHEDHPRKGESGVR
jgi:hypothetical protein